MVTSPTSNLSFVACSCLSTTSTFFFAIFSKDCSLTKFKYAFEASSKTSVSTFINFACDNNTSDSAIFNTSCLCPESYIVCSILIPTETGELLSVSADLPLAVVVTIFLPIELFKLTSGLHPDNASVTFSATALPDALSAKSKG